MYCIYTNSEIDDSSANGEHIFPLSLGGINGFEIPVSAEFNSHVGSKIDGELANCFLVMFKRSLHNAKGHSRKTPIPTSKHGVHHGLNTPIQVSFPPNDIHIYAPKLKRRLTPEEICSGKFNMKIQLNVDVRLRFAAKVFLSAGYFAFGDDFKNNVKTEELRALMNFERGGPNEGELSELQTKGWYFPHPEAQEDLAEHSIFKHLAKFLKCSFVLLIPTDQSLIAVVGVLGDLVGILNCPANTENFPRLGDYDLGHAIIIKNSSLVRTSFRNLLIEFNEHLKSDPTLMQR